MRKSLGLAIGILMALSLAACGEEKQSAEERTPDTGKTTEAASTGNDSGPNTIPEEASETAAENEQVNVWIENMPESDVEEMKVLVAYFSATNTTEGVAEVIADSLSADLYEIVPEQPYTDADLNYRDDNSRTTIEMNDSTARPAISGSVEDMEQYDIVFIGYPIWWGEAPRILNTFMESYDFSGKTIVPFCTSGGSGIGSSATNLADLTEGAMWLSGTRFAGGSSRETIVDWVNGLGLNIEAE